MVTSKAPLRISFFGGGTDLPSFYESSDYGAVLSTSIDSYIYTTVKKHSDIFTEKYRKFNLRNLKFPKVGKLFLEIFRFSNFQFRKKL